MSVAVQTKPDGYGVLTTAVGTLIEVFDAIQSEFINYHPLGYGTSVECIRLVGPDRYEARIKRAKSCD